MSTLLYKLREGPLVETLDAPASPFARWMNRSVLGPFANPVPTDTPVVLWSGSYAELEGGGVFEDDPRTWGPKGWAALEAACERLLAGGARNVLLRPHARHVLSDPVSCGKFLSAWSERGVGVLYDPASMLTPEMVIKGSALDLLARAYEALAVPALEHVAGVLVANVRLVDQAVSVVPLRAPGDLPREAIIRLVDDVGPGVPRVVEPLA